MRTLYTSIALIIAQATSAQLLNGSFENVMGQGDLTGWTNTCLAGSAMEGAPNSGNWSAEVEASNPQGCFQSMLYQAVPSAYDGMPYTLGGWCRNVSGPWAPAIAIDLGVVGVGGGITAMNVGPTTTDTVWTWLSVADTIHLAPGEQAAVLCAPGSVGGPAFALSRFDGIQFFEIFPFAVPERPVLTHLLDASNGTLHIATTNGSILGVRLLDPAGRILPTKTRSDNSTTVRVDLGVLPTGVYIAVVRTDRGEEALRFVVR